MNMYFVYGSGPRARVVTPELTGTLLPGITRDSLLTVAKDLGYEVGTTRISVDEWRKAAESGEITEAFACGTAAVITPIGLAKGAAGEWNHGDGEPGEVTMKLRAALTGIQSGSLPDTHHWMRKLV